MENITENNALIAEFMGFFRARVSRGFAWDNNKIVKPISLHGDLVDTRENGKFHESWDWLMPVVEKIEGLGFNVNISGISCSVTKLLEKKPEVAWVLGDRSRKIELVHIVVVEFIKWYKTQKA